MTKIKQPAIERFRRNLSALMDSRRLTQLDVAEATGVSNVTLSRLLAGKMERPSLDLCEKISTGLGLQVEDLLKSQ